MRGTRKAAVSTAMVSLSLTAALLGASGNGAAAAPQVKSRTNKQLAPGLTLSRIVDPSGPYIVHVLTVAPQGVPLTIDIATAGSIGTYARPSQIAGPHGALAAINGDFTVDPGRPLHPFAEDGALKELGLQNGASFAISRDERSSYIDAESVTVRGRYVTNKRDFSVEEWNTGDPSGGDIVGYTPYGGSAEKPPRNACSVKLKPAAKQRWGPQQVGVSRDYKVVAGQCSSSAMGMSRRSVVLSSRSSGAGATTLKGMKRGHIVRLTWSLAGPA